MPRIEMEKNTNSITQRDLGYDFIRFIAVMMIVIHHIAATLTDIHIKIPDFLYLIEEYRPLMSFRTCGVALFFLLSGAVLCKNYKDVFDIKRFYKKRAIRILIPQQIGFLAAVLATYIVSRDVSYSDKLGMIISFFGLNYEGTFWENFGIQVYWLIGEWFTAVIILIYAVFPLLRWLFIKHDRITTLVISALFIANLKFEIYTYYDGWFSITNSLMCFWCGMLFEKYKSILNSAIIFICFVLMILIYIVNPSNIFGYKYPVCFIFSCLLFVTLYQIKITGSFIRYICKYCYEIYLVHHRIFIILMPELITPDSKNYQIYGVAFLLIGLTFLTAILLSRISKYVINGIYSLCCSDIANCQIKRPIISEKRIS